MPETVIFTAKIPTKLEAVSDFVLKVAQKIKGLPMSEDALFKVRLSLEEALTNAMRHGNKHDAGLAVDVSLKNDDKKLTVEIKDEGKGFDVKSIPDPTVEENRARFSGRGIFLMKRLMDSVEYFDNGRGIRLVKFFDRGP